MRFASFLALLGAGAVHAEVWVSTTGEDILACGSRSAPCASLPFVLRFDGGWTDEIVLMAGIYRISATAVDPGGFYWPVNLSDVVIRSAGSADDVTIDRNYEGRLFVFETVRNVTFRGIRFYRGGWETAPANIEDTAGSLVSMAASSATDVSFVDCVFASNRNPQKGYAGRGSVLSIASGAPQFRHCRFSDNWGGCAGTAYVFGGAAPQFSDCTFEHSGVYEGGWGGVLVPEGTSSGVWRRSVPLANHQTAVLFVCAGRQLLPCPSLHPCFAGVRSGKTRRIKLYVITVPGVRRILYGVQVHVQKQHR